MQGISSLFVLHYPICCLPFQHYQVAHRVLVVGITGEQALSSPWLAALLASFCLDNKSCPIIPRAPVMGGRRSQ